jgi:hypothetical protein
MGEGYMRALADNLQALILILQALLSIVSITLTLILLYKVRKLFRSVTNIPGAVVRAIRDAPGAMWNRLTGKK